MDVTHCSVCKQTVVEDTEICNECLVVEETKPSLQEIKRELEQKVKNLTYQKQMIEKTIDFNQMDSQLTHEGVIEENEHLRRKLFSLETEHTTQNQQLVEGLQLLKLQLETESQNKAELSEQVEKERELNNQITLQKYQIKQLQDELYAVKREIDRLRQPDTDYEVKRR